MAKDMGLEAMDLLDIGGGFSNVVPDTNNNFDQIASKLNSYINELFPEPNVRVIGEVGRLIAEKAGYIVAQIIGKKVNEKKTIHYYINNGIYTTYTVRPFG